MTRITTTYWPASTRDDHRQPVPFGWPVWPSWVGLLGRIIWHTATGPDDCREAETLIGRKLVARN